MIFLKEKLAFMHIQKTGGTSILSLWIDDPRFSMHSVKMKELLEEYRQTKKDELLYAQGVHHYHNVLIQLLLSNGLDPSDYTFFTIIRNPWDAIRSRYAYYQHTITCEMSNWSFEKFVDSGGYGAILNMMNFVAQYPDKFDYILRTESLNDQFDSMCSDLSLDRFVGKLQKHNTTPGDKRHLKFSNRQIKAIQKKMGLYFRRFEYPIFPDQ